MAATPGPSDTPSAPPFRLIVVPVTPFRQNACVLRAEATGRGAVVDPGGDLDEIRRAVAEIGADIEAILLTHGHLDHAGGAAELKEMLQRDLGRPVPVIGPHRADAFLLDELPAAGERFGMDGLRPVTPDRWLDEGDRVEVGGVGFDILHCPGHSPGSVVYHQADAGFLLMGDVLFAGSIGRTDFPYGDHRALVGAIRSKLLVLPDETVFLPGHGGMSTIGRERDTNPYLR